MIKPHEQLHKGLAIRLVVSLGPITTKAMHGGVPMQCSACTPLITIFSGTLTEVRTPEVTTQLRRQVRRRTRGLIVADRWGFASGNWASSLAP